MFAVWESQQNIGNEHGSVGVGNLFIGLQNAWQTDNQLILIASLVLGGLIGERLQLEEKLTAWGKRAENRIGNGGNVGEAFVTATLLFCVGAMAIMGSLQSGLSGDHTTLYAKSLLDGISSLLLATTLGPGVGLAAISVLLYQGLITLAAQWAAAWLNTAVIAEMTAVGGILIMALGLSMLEIKKIRVGNLLPAILVAAILAGCF